MASFNALRKVVEQFIEVLLSKNNKRGEMEDCCDQLEMLCREVDSEIKEKVRRYMEWYDDLKKEIDVRESNGGLREEVKEEDKQKVEPAKEVKKKKRGWF
jgi:hypothetical protein